MKLRDIALPMLLATTAADLTACAHQKSQEKPGLTLEEFNRQHEKGLKQALAEKAQMVQSIRSEFGLDNTIKPVKLELPKNLQKEGCYLTAEQGCYTYSAIDATDAESKGRELILGVLKISKDELERDYCVLITSGDFEFGGKKVFDGSAAPIVVKLLYTKRTSTEEDALRAAKQNSSYEVRLYGEADEEAVYAQFAYILGLNPDDAKSNFLVNIDSGDSITLATFKGK